MPSTIHDAPKDAPAHMTIGPEPHADWSIDDGLFDFEAPPPVSLADKFGVPPMSVLDRRSGDWQARRRRWLLMGIESELGRDAAAMGVPASRNDAFAALLHAGDTIGRIIADGVSVFDPVVCELAYRWHTLPGDRVLDPFAGGSVRGVVASTLARYYVGVDLRTEQIEANESQVGLCGDIVPRWIQGDSQRLDDALDPADEFDLIFSCPPYGDLERYSDNPRDLSVMAPDDFAQAHRNIIQQAAQRLRHDRFAVWVISDVRDKRGAYRGLVADAIQYFTAAGLYLHNDAVLLDHVGTAAVRAERPFRATRKLTRVHQHMLIFVKGNAKAATDRLETDVARPLETLAPEHVELASDCGHWTGDQYCGAGARLYASGHRCTDHSPAALAGRAEPTDLGLFGAVS